MSFAAPTNKIKKHSKNNSPCLITRIKEVMHHSKNDSVIRIHKSRKPLLLQIILFQLYYEE